MSDMISIGKKNPDFCIFLSLFPFNFFEFSKDFEKIQEIKSNENCTIYKAKNILDDNYYILRKIKVYKKNLMVWEKHIKQLMRLHHANVLRYFQVN